jgi:hypothetical protein
MVKVAVIGSAGRGGDRVKMTKDLFSRMLEATRHHICETLKLKWSDVELQSGGAAWSGMWAFIHLLTFF